jgi:hypothetical protein
VVDADPASVDVGDRLGLAVRGRLEWPALTVVPATAGLRSATARNRIATAVRDHDLVVVDLPRGAGAPGPSLDTGLLDHVDRLVVASDGSPESRRVTRRWADLVAVARDRGHLPARLEVVAVLCADDPVERGDWAAIEAQLALPIVASVPQWWGRTPPNLGFGPTLGFPVLDDALRSVAAQAPSRSQAASASGQSRAAIHGAVSSVK